MRVFMEPLFCHWNTNELQKVYNPRSRLFFCDASMCDYCFLYLVSYCEYRIERRMRVLKNHCDLITAKLLHFMKWKFQQIFSSIQYFSINYSSWLFHKA